MGNHGVWADNEISCIPLSLANIMHTSTGCALKLASPKHYPVYTKSLASSPIFSMLHEKRGPGTQNYVRDAVRTSQLAMKSTSNPIAHS